MAILLEKFCEKNKYPIPSDFVKGWFELVTQVDLFYDLCNLKDDESKEFQDENSVLEFLSKAYLSINSICFSILSANDLYEELSYISSNLCEDENDIVRLFFDLKKLYDKMVDNYERNYRYPHNYWFTFEPNFHRFMMEKIEELFSVILSSGDLKSGKPSDSYREYVKELLDRNRAEIFRMRTNLDYNVIIYRKDYQDNIDFVYTKSDDNESIHKPDIYVGVLAKFKYPIVGRNTVLHKCMMCSEYYFKKAVGHHYALLTGQPNNFLFVNPEAP